MRPDDSIEGALFMLALFLLLAIYASWTERRDAFAAYEQRRLEYSKQRLEKIRRCEM